MSIAPSSRTGLGVLALVLCAALWSLNGPLIKLLNREGSGVPGITIACYRSLAGGLIFLPLALRHVRSLGSVAPVWPIASLVAFTVMTAAIVIATTMTAAANAIVLQYTSAIWVFLLSPRILGERPAWREGLVLIIAMAGVGVIFIGDDTGSLAGLIVALISGLGYGVLTIVLRGLRTVHPTVAMCINTVGSGLLLLPAVAIWGSFKLSGPQIGLVLLLSLVAFALPYILFSWALRHVEAHRAALITLLEVVLNPLFTYLVVHEAPPRSTLLGGPLILIGVLAWMLLTLARRRPSTSPAIE